MSTIVKTLPKASQSRGPSPSHQGQGSVDLPFEVHHHQELHVHDDRTQTVDVMQQFESAKSQTQRLSEHKDSEISRLMSEVSSLNSDKSLA